MALSCATACARESRSPSCAGEPCASRAAARCQLVLMCLFIAVCLLFDVAPVRSRRGLDGNLQLWPLCVVVLLNPAEFADIC